MYMKLQDFKTQTEKAALRAAFSVWVSRKHFEIAPN